MENGPVGFSLGWDDSGSLTLAKARLLDDCGRA